MPSTALRFVNLLSGRQEARILLDGNTVVGNSLTGETSDFVAVEAGAHRVKVVPSYGKGVLLESSIQIAANTKTSLILAGGPTRNAPDAKAVVLPLVHSNAAAPRPPAPGKPPVCTLVVANCDLRGPVKIDIATVEGPVSLTVPPGKTQAIDKCPVAALDLRVTPLFKLATGGPATAALNIFSPSRPATYYCVLYATGANYATRALFLSPDSNGDLGQPIVDDR